MPLILLNNHQCITHGSVLSSGYILMNEPSLAETRAHKSTLTGDDGFVSKISNGEEVKHFHPSKTHIRCITAWRGRVREWTSVPPWTTSSCTTCTRINPHPRLLSARRRRWVLCTTPSGKSSSALDLLQFQSTPVPLKQDSTTSSVCAR